MSGVTTAPGPYGRRVGREAREARVRSSIGMPPVVHDGTARSIQRPQDPEAQEAYDSGTQKRHTLTTLLVIDERCPLAFLSDTDEGKASDKSLAALAGYTVPPGRCRSQEQGFQGVFLPGITRCQPENTPRGGDRPPPEKVTHRRISSIRIRIEQARGGVKRDRMVKDTIRLLKAGSRDPVMGTWYGLPHVRLQDRPWAYAS